MRDRTHLRVLLSSLLHALVLLAFTVRWVRSPHIAPLRLPGTEHGTRLLTYYSPGGTPAQPAAAPVPKRPASVVTPVLPRPAALAKAEQALTPPAEAGAGSAGASGLGQGNINIALQKFFPFPRPSLATLPHGQSGEVVLNAVIDAQGNVSELTVLHSLTPEIDSSVLATVRQWTYTPATKDGLPVPSEQELHFRFERG